jgi:hypothetical protein
MSAFLHHDSSPERLLWCAVIHQAVRDLGHPNSNVHTQQTISPFQNKIWRTAAELIFSGKQDKHVAWEYSGLDPKVIRADVLAKAREGVVVGQIGSRETPMGPIDYREVRKLLVRAFDQVKAFYAREEEDGLKKMFAEDCRLDFLSLHSFVKRDVYHKEWGIEL